MNIRTISDHWEVCILELNVRGKKKYKVTRMMNHVYKAESRLYTSKKKAINQFYEWLRYA